MKPSERAILVRTGWEYKELGAGVPGGRWLKAQGAWRYPMTYFTALRIDDLFGKKLRDWVNYSKKFYPYLLAAEVARDPANSYEYMRDLSAYQLPPIPHTKSEPWLHQLQAFHFAYMRESCMLDMDMGTGKTKVVFDLIANRDHRVTLVVAPPKILESQVWEEQAVKHWPESAGALAMLNLYEGNLTVAERTQRADEWMASHRRWLRAGKQMFGIVMVNYEAVWRSPFKEWAKEQNWDFMILEESHRAKKAGGKASKALFEIGQHAQWRLAMSGTPMAHSPLDVYAQYRFLDSGIFGTNMQRFNAQYALYGGFQNREVIGFQNEADLQRKYYQIAYHVDESVQSLPKTQDIFRYVKLHPETKRQYNRMKKEMVAEFGGREVTAANTLTRTLRLQQITAGHVTLDPIDEEAKGPVTIVGHEKRDMLIDVLEDLDPKDPVVVFTMFKPDMEAVRQACKASGRSFAEISGFINEIKKWKAGEANVLGVQIKTGAEGLDLTRAHYAVYYSLTPSLAFYKQSRKRLHRPGQTKRTKFIHLVANATVDGEIMKALAERQDVIKHLLTIGFFEG